MTAEWEPPGLSPWLGFATDSTAVLGRSSQCSGTRFVEPPSEARLTVYGCEGGSGTVELRAGSITGRLLDSITITVRTPTPTPTPVTPSGELSATKTSIVVGDEVTVSAVNVSPSGQSVYIVTNGRLGFAGPGTCHYEIDPRSSGKSTRSWTLEGCSPPGSGSVTLKTSHNGQTLVLDSITIDVSPAPTATPTPNTPLPTATPPAVSNLVATASTTSVRLTWNDLDGATKYRVEHRLSPSTGSWTPVDTTANVRNVANLTPETSYAFRIRAYGDGTTFRAEWGAEAATTASTVGTVTLAKPPAPGGLSASSSGENSVSVSWTALTGADKYEVQYRQGSSGNWSTYKNDITGTSPTVSGLQCDTGYQFSVRAYGDDVTYRADWGAWSSASREVRTSMCTTPTPTPTPTNPTGSISASPAKIAVGQTTTITASWDNVKSTPKIRFGPQLAQTCSGPPAPGTPHTEIVAVETLTLTGCGDTPTVTVQLWDVDSNESLAAVNVTVLPLPKITGTMRVGYRYLEVNFAAHSEFQRVAIEWRNKSMDTTIPYTRFAELPATGTPDEPQRAIINRPSHEADVRGLPYLKGVLIEVRVVGTTGDGLVAVGPAYHVSRLTQPPGIGHLPDHVMMYDDTDLEDSSENIAEWVKENAAAAASRWASIVPGLGLESCKGTLVTLDDVCPQNSDHSVVKIVIGLCLDKGSPACYSVGDGSLERELDGETRITFRASPPGVVWTDNPAEDGKRVRESQSDEKYLWFGNVLVHEFGHAFGLADRDEHVDRAYSYEEEEYDGIMNDLVPGDDTIKDDDKAALIAIYETHIKGQGW